MPAGKGKSLLAAKLGEAGRKAVAAHADDDTVISGGGGLPEGIENGVAQLIQCYFGTYENGDNAGKLYFRAAGVVILPDKVGGAPVKGLQTSIMEPLCDTPNRSRKDVDQHVSWVMNELRKLGIDTKGAGLDDMEGFAEALQEAQPYFRFRTWKGEATEQFPNPRVNEQWQGYLPDYSPEETDGVDDDTAEAPAVAPKASPAKPAASVSASVKKPAAAAAAPAKKPPVKPATKPAPEPEPEPTEPEGEDWDSLAEAADSGDEDAQAKLTAQAGLFNVSEDDVNNAANWTEVAELIKAAAESDEAGEDGDESATDPEWEPAKEEIYFYLPPKAKKKIECEVTTVDTKTRTVGLKGLNDKKIYKGVSWDDLAGE